MPADENLAGLQKDPLALPALQLPRSCLTIPGTITEPTRVALEKNLSDVRWRAVESHGSYVPNSSTAHYRTALSSKFSQTRSKDDVRGASSAPESDGEAESGEEDNLRRHVCLHPHCFKAYRQASGLRYHMKHGHPHQQPAQLSTVPPALARQLPSKTRKMRRKGAS
ncbi:hypothetical protein H0H87_006261 [Tephrocybe sp. NHM501043]|nr:hypothetical protein H0H87_006261 [Tephrocybe sp. NHM501043]